MGRKTRYVTVPQFAACDNRDQGKMFFIKEWSAAHADKWAQRLTFAFNKGAGQIPLDLAGIGWEGIAIVGINTFLRGTGDSEEIMRLADELLECVQIVRDHKHPENPSPILPETDDIEEVATRWWLRDQVVSVHTGFSVAGALSGLLTNLLKKSPDSAST
jgi:hypothetical protein